MLKTNIILSTVAAGLILSLASCAVKGRDEETTTSSDNNNSTPSNAITQSLQSDLNQLLSMAEAYDFTALHGLDVPEAGCTGEACATVTQACDLFSQGEFIISSFYIKRDNYVSAKLNIEALEAAIAAVKAAKYADGTSIESILNNSTELSNLRSVCSVLISSTTLLLQSQMGQLQTQIASMQQALITAVNNGIPGPVGPAGAQGATGPMGEMGPQGNAGPQGATGPQGTVGPTGPRGTTGAPGVAGPQGVTGATGRTGATGPQGATGATGPDGAAGNNGYTSLIQLSAEPAGAGHCANGGVKIEAGPDINGNMVLEPAEISVGNTQYVCNGAAL